MKRSIAMLVLFALLPAAAKRKEPPPSSTPPAPAPPASATVAREADGVRTDLTWDGPVLGWALPKDPDGRRTLFVLVGPPPDDKPEAACSVAAEQDTHPAQDARLFRWSLDRPDRLEPLATGLSHGRLDAVTSGEIGRERLVLVRDGAIDEVMFDTDDGKPAARSLVRDAAIAGTYAGPRAARSAADADDPGLRLTVAGELQSFGRRASGDYGLTGASPLPIRILPGARRILIDTPEVNALGTVGSDGPLFATDPEPIGTSRVRTFLITPDLRPSRAPVECWARLPGPERVLDSGFAVMDGAPVWIALTMSAEKLSVFGEKALRIYGLSGDRTRVGEAPRATATTGLNIWQPAFPVVADLDGDGHDDLVLGYWKGLRRSIAALEVYRGAGKGQLGKRHDMEIPVEEADEGFLSFGRDADGDGRPDLIVLDGSAALVFPGSKERVSERPVAPAPSRRVPLPAGRPRALSANVMFAMGGGVTISRDDPGFGTPRPIDIDGDGRVELIFAGNVSGRGRISVIAFRGAAGSLAPASAIQYK